MMSEGTGTEVLRPPEKKARLGDPGGGFDGAAVPARSAAPPAAGRAAPDARRVIGREDPKR